MLTFQLNATLMKQQLPGKEGSVLSACVQTDGPGSSSNQCNQLCRQSTGSGAGPKQQHPRVLEAL